MCMVRVDLILDAPASKADWLIRLWRRAVDVFMQDAGDQDLIGQTFFGSSPLQHLRSGCVLQSYSSVGRSDIHDSLSNGEGSLDRSKRSGLPLFPQIQFLIRE